MDPPSSTQSASRRRVQKAQYATAGGPLLLSALPRFHPAAYASNNSSLQTTPSSTGASPQPLSPRSQQRADSHRHLAIYHSMLNSQPAGNGEKPPSPKLVPLAGSPGAVTPLELEGDSYLTAGATGAQVDAILREEATRRGDMSPRRQINAGGA